MKQNPTDKTADFLKRAAAKMLPLVKELERLYPDAVCSLTYETPFQLLVSTQLSAQCTDARVNMVTPALFARFPDAQAFAAADIEELEELIRSTGFYHNKAKNLKRCAQDICDKFGGTLPDTMEGLLSLAGVGRKTANLVLGDAFHKPSYVIDTHAIRLCGRIGLTQNTDPVKIENDLRFILPPDEFLRKAPLSGITARKKAETSVTVWCSTEEPYAPLESQCAIPARSPRSVYATTLSSSSKKILSNAAVLS